MMNDEQRAQIIAQQKNAFTYSEVTYEAGNLDIKTITGWMGYTDIAHTPSMMGPIGRGIIVVLVIQDIETAMHEQEQIQIPLPRVISTRTSPRLP